MRREHAIRGAAGMSECSACFTSADGTAREGSGTARPCVLFCRRLYAFKCGVYDHACAKCSPTPGLLTSLRRLPVAAQQVKSVPARPQRLFVDVVVAIERTVYSCYSHPFATRHAFRAPCARRLSPDVFSVVSRVVFCYPHCFERGSAINSIGRRARRVGGRAAVEYASFAQEDSSGRPPREVICRARSESELPCQAGFRGGSCPCNLFIVGGRSRPLQRNVTPACAAKCSAAKGICHMIARRQREVMRAVGGSKRQIRRHPHKREAAGAAGEQCIQVLRRLIPACRVAVTRLSRHH